MYSYSGTVSNKPNSKIHLHVFVVLSILALFYKHGLVIIVLRVMVRHPYGYFLAF
jgi:hypothetical protein